MRAPRRRTTRATRAMATNGVKNMGNDAYEDVKRILGDASRLESLSGLAGWDELVIMPSGQGAAKARAAALATLAGVIHEMKTSEALGKALGDAECHGAKDVANLRLARDAYAKATRVPNEMVRRMAEVHSRGYQDWVKARAASDFSMFAPVLKESLELTKARCALVAPGKDAFDAALDDYERGMTKARLNEIFPVVRDAIAPLIRRVYEKKTPTALVGVKNPLEGEFDVDLQAKMSKEIAIKLGFDMSKGRLDVSVHPFTGGCGPNDVRMTTRYKANDLAEGLTGTIHETGHSLYEQGRCEEFIGQPVSEAHSMGVHESQSLLWERMVALSKPFSHFLLRELQATFPAEFDGVSADTLYAAMNTVKNPSTIRVESDELTYPLHIFLRTELELGLMDGSIAIDDLPAKWNEKMKAYLGVDITDDAKGVLQDVHWSSGALPGYFPTYTLGSMYAVQIYNTAHKQIADLDAKIEKGEFAELREWLRVNVHVVGSECESADELLTRVTGKPLDAQEYIDYLTNKYTELYGL